ncbi:efflux RND transporter periplasmic adaptor subunit [Vibrio aestuarianus]|uniref:Efflux RND transporter periplasmic adaptor subunit n=1 Tax=Vibrio aestuarianus TaxID=28171 RepID=A0AAX3UAA8_9VIBR|nr:efflux RND transporter periplasmic adaptor subunit [Vibrio aestuarianus]WGK83708.1 efflux RND transporter periplasmic adaptor subunit [Vibrio aestuarianus]
MKLFNVAVLSLAIGGALGFVASQYFPHQDGENHDMQAMSDSSSPSEPLYWVAPMDPNYKRDKPGKSPMGMDLIPVYSEDESGTDEQVGTVTINPAVENNLGVKTERAVLTQLSPRIETVGYIAFDESLLWQTNVRVSGWVEKLHINAVGEQVNKGDVLFTLYSPDLVKAQEELLNAYRTDRRGLVKGATERLLSLGVDREQIQRIVKQGKATQFIEIKAVADGVIASLNIREGGYLSPAQAVISAGPLNEVWVDAEVFERQAHWINAGSFATMTLDSIPGKEWQGLVDYVYPILDPKTRTLRMRLKFANPNGDLKPNMFANIALQPVSQQAVLTIPKAAVIRSGGMTRVVLAQGEGKYRSARISIGREAGDRIEVLQGLTEQDSVVTSAHFMLDSESSQTADLSRINGVEAANEVWVDGSINTLLADFGMITLEHSAVKEWAWQAGEMNFTVDEGIDLSVFAEGQSVRFLILKQNGDYLLKALQLNSQAVQGGKQ